jgi:hypothetical protein
MKLQDIFAKDINRPINGVIKADQSDQAYNELEEYEITKEVDKHLRKFVAAYLAGIARGDDPGAAAKMAVWVSGFFGSGKSHLIKILSYLLANQPVREMGKAEKTPLEFFLEKTSGDASFQDDLRRVAGAKSEVILFNIDSKAEQNHTRDSILRVFLKVFNEHCGYSGDHPEVAHMERFLDEKGKYQTFKETLQSDFGLNWIEERDSYHFHTTEVAGALGKAIGQPVDALQPWIDDLEKRLSLTVENFAKWVKQYLDARGGGIRLVFLVDEVGGFIGGQPQLMLNLQTITENLGTVCKGRAWVVVTSQEDMDAVVGGAFEKAREMDFSKIQGRFSTRLSLSGSNADEVIQRRLLAKKDEATTTLKALFAEKGDILKNQITFRDAGMTLRAFSNADNFAVCYPFPPYQFLLVQKIFEASRKFGASGGHLSQGERSMLDAFQTAAQAIEAQPVGALVTLDAFYPSIEGFLEGVVRVAINRAQAIPDGAPLDSRVLKTLFLIRYVEEIPGNIDNLVTFFVDEVDADKRALRTAIEQSLLRLERETLISRNGDLYFFLTNEERDINKEIKAQEYSPADRHRLLGEVVFDEVLRDTRRYRYPVNGKDFDLARQVDTAPVGARTEGALVVSVITPMAEDYSAFNEPRCLQASMDGDVGQLIIKLSDDNKLADEIAAYIKTEAYLRLKSDGAVPATTRRIFDDKREENRQRRDRIRAAVSELVETAKFYIRGNAKSFTGAPKSAVDAALQYLVENAYSKLGLIQQSPADPMAEIRTVLADTNGEELDLIGGSRNGRALKDLLDYIELLSTRSQAINLGAMINERFARHPYGWREQDTLLLVCRLLMAGEIELHAGGAKLLAGEVYGQIDGSNKWNRVTISRRQTVDRGALLAVRNLARDLFGTTAPDTEDALAAHLRASFEARLQSLNQWATLAGTGAYPGKDDIADLQGVIRKVLAQRDSFSLISYVASEAKTLTGQIESFQRLETFYTQQRPQWEALRRAFHESFEPNAFYLRKDANAAKALEAVRSILNDPLPYGRIRESGGLIDTLSACNDRVIAERRLEALARIDPQIESVRADLAAIGVDADFSNRCLLPLQDIRRRIEHETRTGQLTELVKEAAEAEDEAHRSIEEAVAAATAKAAAAAAAAAAPSAPFSTEDPQDVRTGGFKEVPRVKQPENFRQRRQVNARTLMGAKPYLESKADVEAYLAALRSQLEEALAQNARIEIL